MKKIENAKIVGKKVIVRCDFNVPMKDNVIQDDTRIVESIKTLKYVISRAKKVIILSHMGRIKKLEDLKENSLLPVCKRLSELLNHNARKYKIF